MLLGSWRGAGAERARDGPVDERGVRDVDQIRENGRGQHRHRARATRHRENRREGQARVAQLRMQTRLLRGTCVTARMQERSRLRKEEREAERDAGKQSWRAARQSGGFLDWPWIV